MKKLTYIALLLTAIFACRENMIDYEKLNVTSTIYIDSVPSGALIFLNNEITYKETPDSLPGLDPGLYLITLVKSGYSDTTVQVNLKKGKSIFINIKL